MITEPAPLSFPVLNKRDIVRFMLRMDMHRIVRQRWELVVYDEIGKINGVEQVTGDKAPLNVDLLGEMSGSCLLSVARHQPR